MCHYHCRYFQKPTFDSVEEVPRHYATDRCHTALIPEDRQRVMIRRKHSWSDAKRALKHRSFNDKICP